MKPVMQDRLGGIGKGNCFSACIASLLELPVSEVPHFCDGNNENWREETNKFLVSFGFFYQDIKLIGDMRDELVAFWGYHVMSGDGPRGVRHSVIGYKGKIVHDPHPSGNGLNPNQDFEYGFLIPLVPKVQHDQ